MFELSLFRTNIQNTFPAMRAGKFSTADESSAMMKKERAYDSDINHSLNRQRSLVASVHRRKMAPYNQSSSAEGMSQTVHNNDRACSLNHDNLKESADEIIQSRTLQPISQKILADFDKSIIMYVYHIQNRYVVQKYNHTYCSLKSKDLAEHVADILADSNWDADSFPKVLNFNGKYHVFSIQDNSIKLVSTYTSKEEALDNYIDDVNEFIDNPNKTEYGAYIYKNNYGSFIISKSIKGTNRIFGYFKELNDAKFVKAILIESSWNVNDLNHIYFNQFNSTYDIIGVYNNVVRILDSFDSLEDALINLEDVLNSFEEKKMIWDEPFINRNGNLLSVHGPDSNYWGSFKTFEDACSARDFLIDIDWNLSKVNYQDIHEYNGYFWRFAPYGNYIKIVAKYTSFDDAFLNQNNLSDFSLNDLNNPDNQYDPINRHIWKKGDKFLILKRIGGQIIDFGSYSTKEEAIRARDEFEADNWTVTHDKDSVFYDEDYDDSFFDIVSSLSLWQKQIYDSIDKMDGDTFVFDDLLESRNLRHYKHGNFESKVHKYLNELIDLGLVEDLGNSEYRPLWK